MDKQLQQRLLAGHPGAFERFFELYADEMIRLGYAILANPAEAEDAVQDAMIGFIEALRAGRFSNGNGSLSAYLRVCVRNHCIDRLRKQKSFITSLEEERIHIDEPLDTLSGSPSHTLDEKRLRAVIESAIKTLPPAQRAVIVMRVIDEMPYNEIAKELGITIDYVKNLLARGRKRLREEINAITKGGQRDE